MVLLFLFAKTTVFAQVKTNIILISDSINLSSSIKKSFSLFKNAKSDADTNLNYLLLGLYEQGHLAARIDSLQIDSGQRIIHLTIGPVYKWAYLKPGNVDEEVLSLSKYRSKLYSAKPISYSEVERLLKKTITFYENNGFPFASVKLDSIEIKDTEISASIRVNKDIKISIDSILLKGSEKVNPIFIYNYIGIKPGDLYNEAQIKKIKNRLKELPFLRETKPIDIIFSKEANKLNLYLEDKKASQFNGILGVLPDNNNPSKILFTGDAFIKLQNSLGRGELIEVNWRKLQTQTQDLKMQFVYPFLFSTPFGLDYKLNIYKRDTTFLNVNNIIGIQYWLSGGNYLKVFINTRNSSLLSTKSLEYLTKIPDNADVRARHYGLEIKKDFFDYRFNPRKGYVLIFTGSAGTREILKNPKLKEEIYEGLVLKTTQYNAESNMEIYIPFFNKTTLKIASKSAFVYGKQLFNNELFRFGGLKTLRGFDEESIFASAYSVLNIEYRYLLEQNSYAHVFWNGAWYENNSINKYITDTPYGFGLGISFESKPGIFSISYALGKQFNNPILIRAGKVHFGFVSYF